MKASSKVGSIEIVGDTVQLKRQQILGSPAEARILKIDHLTGIEFKRAGVIDPGYIKMIHPGGASNSSILSSKYYDLDTIRFDIFDQDEFLKVRSVLMERITGTIFVDDEAQRVASGQIAMAAIGIIVAAFAIWFWITIFTS
ncbi:hypothetical protein [Sphingobium yanoikuyae]|uniref:Uncharacterized protein n=1 Tax=Sphingobium yanoikuyae TaxID=13690 RepID=A0A0J9CV64_SPHYA|nr:hypothetical protein [Sphingobium yanoikuyae]ATP20399.1 hypothetical protein BV87_19800 [Sphingobium yanoikuyae]KMW29008.1 hypothetical protein BV87_16160 [Sphingobium yanoikuyae]